MDLVTAASIEELDQVVEVMEHFQMNGSSWRTFRVARRAARVQGKRRQRDAAKASWNALLSPKGVLERA